MACSGSGPATGALGALRDVHCAEPGASVRLRSGGRKRSPSTAVTIMLLQCHMDVEEFSHRAEGLDQTVRFPGLFPDASHAAHARPWR